MININGNIKAIVQVKTVTQNDLGIDTNSWEDYTTINGYLDYQGGNASISTYNAKVQETTHLFICDYVKLPEEAECRLMVDNQPYEVLYIDNPMNLNYHLEIFLKYVGM